MQSFRSEIFPDVVILIQEAHHAVHPTQAQATMEGLHFLLFPRHEYLMCVWN